MGNCNSCQKTPTLDEDYETALRKALMDMKAMLQKEKKTNSVLRQELSKIRNMYEIEKKHVNETSVVFNRQLIELKRTHENFEAIKQENKNINIELITLSNEIIDLKHKKDVESEKHNDEVTRLLSQIDILSSQLNSHSRPRFFGVF